MPGNNTTACGGRPANWSTLRSISQLTAAIIIGSINTLCMFAFVAAPLVLWLAWRYPYLVIPPAIAYYFLSFDEAERKDGKPWPEFTKNFWVLRLGRSYHDLQIHLDPALHPSKMTGDEQFIFGVHPHGVLVEYRIMMDGMLFDVFPKLRSWRVLAASVLFKIPMWREMSLWSHCIDAGKVTAQYALDKGHSLFIVPGGEQEQIRGQFQQEILYLKSRMGFVKLALRNGLPLVPVYVFGANDTFHTSSFLQSFRLAITGRFRIALPIFWGRWGLLIPHEIPMRVVFGAPVTFEKTVRKNASDGGSPSPGLKDVTDEEIKEAHAAYVAAIKRLFDENKSRFGYGDRELRIC